MLDLLAHLWPDFSLMLSGESAGISACFWLVTFIVFIVSIVALVVHYCRFSARMQALRSLLKGQAKETLAQNRRETLQKAGEIKAPDVGMLWREFDESLGSEAAVQHVGCRALLQPAHAGRRIDC